MEIQQRHIDAALQWVDIPEGAKIETDEQREVFDKMRDVLREVATPQERSQPIAYVAARILASAYREKVKECDAMEKQAQDDAYERNLMD